ncbi:hypothetical protein B0919_06975 [Hymenobacter sp. CRA2]|nr:hypothetical protein B0919_06975 [Hymenobacter sp. CRA2]
MVPASTIGLLQPMRLPVQPVQTAGTGLTASYFSNGTLAGAPVVRRLDPSLDFQWGKGAPAPGVPEDNFSIRWEGLLAAPSTGSYRFVPKTTGEVRLWVNGVKVLDTWNGNKKGSEGSVSLAAGEKTSIKLEFAAGEGDARFQLQWMPPGQAPQLIPTSYLYPLGSPTTPDPVMPAAPVAAAPVAPAAPAKAEPKVAKAAAEADKAEAKVAKAETKVAKAENKVAQAETKVAKAETKADKASAKVAKVETDAAKAGDEAAPAIVEPGVYILTSRTTGKPLEVLDPARPNSRAYQAAGLTPVEAAKTAPQWRIESLGNGYYRLLVPGNNKVLEVLGSSTSNGTAMNVWTYYSGNNQLWRIEPTEHGYYKLLAKHSNKALSVRDSVDGVVQWRYSGKEGQMWKLTPVQEEAPAPLIMAGARPGVGANKMSIYPNPSNGVVQLRYELPEEIPTGWVLYNQNGAPVRVSDYRRQSAGPHHQTLDFTGLPAGDYNLRMTVGTVTTREQLQLRKSSAPEAGAPAPAGE